MQSDPKNPPLENNPQAGGATRPLPASGPPVIGAPPPLAAASPPMLIPQTNRKPASARNLVAILLSVFLGLFLADAIVSFADTSLVLFFDLHFLSTIGGLMSFFAVLMAIVIYCLMGLTPMIPKRLFLPLTLFYPFSALLAFPVMIYIYGRIPQVAWCLSFCQVIVGLGVLYWFRGGFKFRWPLVAEDQLAVRRFCWWNLAGFLLANVFLLLPAVVAYFVVCAALAVDHFTEGFLKLRPGGLTVQARKYVRNDGKTIQLYPMAHVADADFYQEISQSFPSNSIILMEGVTDSRNLLTNKITYKRMAAALGLGEQHEEFKPKPGRGKWVPADVDVKQFTTNTIDLLNLVMLIHAKGVKPETVVELLERSDPSLLGEQIFDDLLKKRNRRLLEEIQARLPQTEHIIVPWGAAHMPGIAKEIQKSGFRLDQTRDYVAIRFGSAGKERSDGKPQNSP